MVLFYFIVAGIMMFANVFIYYRYLADGFTDEDIGTIFLMGILSGIIAWLWPLEILVGALTLVALWAQSVREQAEEKKETRSKRKVRKR